MLGCHVTSCVHNHHRLFSYFNIFRIFSFIILDFMYFGNKDIRSVFYKPKVSFLSCCSFIKRDITTDTTVFYQKTALNIAINYF